MTLSQSEMDWDATFAVGTRKNDFLATIQLLLLKMYKQKKMHLLL